MFKFILSLYKPSADKMLNGGLKLNHFRDAEYRNVLGSDIYDCRLELNKLLEKYGCYLIQDKETNDVLLRDEDTNEVLPVEVWK